jgi:hypothetical protein
VWHVQISFLNGGEDIKVVLNKNNFSKGFGKLFQSMFVRVSSYLETKLSFKRIKNSPSKWPLNPFPY